MKNFIEDILICNEYPTQEMISYQLESLVKEKINSYLLGLEKKSFLFQKSIITLEDEILLDIGDISFLTKGNQVEKTIRFIHCALSQYEPYLIMKNILEEQKPSLQEQEKLCYVTAELMLKITPEMKKKILMERKLNHITLPPNSFTSKKI